MLALIPGVFSIVSDPDVVGIGLGAGFLLGLYVAWRMRIVGGIILIVFGALMLAAFFTNLFSPGGIPGGSLESSPGS